MEPNGVSTEQLSDVPLPVLVRELNLIYHEVEAQVYDRTHPEIWSQEAPILRGMLTTVAACRRAERTAILDFGCGTGFASFQAVSVLGTQKVASLVCCDLSPAMLDQCKARIDRVFPKAMYISDLEKLLKSSDGDLQFDLVITNSTLHHIYDWRALVEGLVGLLKPGGFYLMGHEPSSRFRRNAELEKVCSSLYAEWGKWRKFLSYSKYISYVSRRMGLAEGVNVLKETSRRAFRFGLTKRRLPLDVVQGLVDYHVPVSSSPPEWGFDIETLKARVPGNLVLSEFKSYAFLGVSLQMPDLPGKWKRLGASLAAKYPLDGAMFCALWRKPQGSGAHPPAPL